MPQPSALVLRHPSRRAGSALAALALTLLLAAPAALAAGELSPPLGPVLNLAHRGLSELAPEHTLYAYDGALRADTDFLECDLQLSKDGVLVCIHDTTVDRTARDASGAPVRGRVDSFTLAELRQLDFGRWFNQANPDKARPEYVGARVVTLAEQLDCYRALSPRLRFHVETKGPGDYPGNVMETALVAVLAARGLVPAGTPDPQTSPVIVQSFELPSLSAVRGMAPSLPTAWLTAAPPPDAQTGTAPPYVDVVAPNYLYLLGNPSYVTGAHANGHEVHTYTVNTATEMDALLQIGVDGIFTNRADLLRGRIDARGTGTTKEARGNPTDPLVGCAPGALQDPVVPEVPVAALLPLAALVLLTVTVTVSRRTGAPA